MAQVNPPTVNPHEEKTFRTYNADQGKNYARGRPDYHPNVYRTVLDQHGTGGGRFETVLDIGCGPGNAVRALAPHFRHAIGLDPSDGMISAARSLGGTSSTGGEAIRYEVGAAEALGRDITPAIADASVDLIVAANAAHWFDMPAFWRSAARVLRPGGSVAVWTSGEIRVHPDMPNAAAIQEVLDRIDEEHLKPYYAPGNFLVRNGYSDLPLPWMVEPPVPEFSRPSFVRREWGLDEEFFTGIPTVTMEMLEATLRTASPITRWQQAHPDLVGTERDVVRLYRRAIERLSHEAGVPEGEETMRGAMRGVLLFVQKTTEVESSS